MNGWVGFFLLNHRAGCLLAIEHHYEYGGNKPVPGGNL